MPLYEAQPVAFNDDMRTRLGTDSPPTLTRWEICLGGVLVLLVGLAMGYVISDFVAADQLSACQRAVDTARQSEFTSSPVHLTPKDVNACIGDD
jgi:hypothetical protein